MTAVTTAHMDLVNGWGIKSTAINGTPLKRKEISSRRIRPTHPHIQVSQMVYYARNWQESYEFDGDIVVYDEGLAQYALCDRDSHHKYYAALMLNKPSLRCSLAKSPPNDILEQSNDNRMELIYDEENHHFAKVNGYNYRHGHHHILLNGSGSGGSASSSTQSSPIPQHMMLDADDKIAIQYLRNVLARRGFKFNN